MASRDEKTAEVLRTEPFRGVKAIGPVRLVGLQSLSEDSVWRTVGGRPQGPVVPGDAVALLARLQTTGLFSAIAPAVVAGDDGTSSLEIELTENPRVRSVRLRGLSEFRSEDVLERLLEAPSTWATERSKRQVREAESSACPVSLPPRDSLARLDDGEVQPGIVWQGLRAALDRALRYLRGRGYPLARLEGSLTASGILYLDVDEGRVSAVEVRGLDSSLAREVESELRLERGDVFSAGELEAALERIERRWPFVRADRRTRSRAPPTSVQIETWPDGSIEFRSAQAARAPGDADAVRPRQPPDVEADDAVRPRRRSPDLEADDDGVRSRRRSDLETDDDAVRPQRHPDVEADDDVAERADHRDDRIDARSSRTRRLRDRLPGGSWYGFDGDKLVVYLRAARSRGDVQWIELIRHTPVTGFAPGLAATATLYDPADRVHLLLDGSFNINTRRPSRDLQGGTFLERLGAGERLDWLLGARVRIPLLAVAELGGQLHTLTDTPDRWRISAVDSYLYSALLGRADREYYRRSGYSAFVTLHLFEMLTLGTEYLRDQYDPLPAPRRVWSLFNRDDPRYGSAPVDRGEMGSLLFRAEYRSEKVPLHRVGSMWRNPETSLVSQQPGTIGVRSIGTVEVSDRSLGGIFDFTKVLSDSFVTLETGRSDTLTLRARAAFGRGLPLQKQEGLGGWTALRGYDFKEFRGDASLLGTLQYEGSHFGVFFDLGSVRQAGNWIDPKPAAGASFSFADGSTRMEAAWRLDSRARLLPDFRILFAVPL